MKDSEKVAEFEKDFSTIFRSKNFLLKQLTKGFFDSALARNPRLSKTIQGYVGRTQESIDFFTGVKERVLSEFIDSGFKIPKSFKGVNYGKGTLLDIDKMLGGNNFYDTEKSFMGVSDSWFDKFKVFSSQAPSDRRYFDNLLFEFISSFLANPNKGSFKDIDSTRLKDLLNDFGSAQFATILLSLSEDKNLKLSKIKEFTAALNAPFEDITTSLEFIVKVLFSERNEIDDFRGGVSPGKLKSPSKYNFLFAISNWISESADFSDVNSKSEAISSVKEFFESFDTEGHENFGKFKEYVKSVAKRFYDSKRLNLLDSTVLESIKILFSSDAFLNSMLRTDTDGNYRILWENYVSALFEATSDGEPIKLTREMIPAKINGKPLFVLDGENWVSIESLRSSYSFEGAHLYVHRIAETGTVEVGISKIENMQKDFSKLSIDIYEGFYTSDGRTIHGAWLSNSRGSLMISEVNLNDFSIRSDTNKHWVSEFSIEDISKGLFVSFIIASGSNLVCYLQKTKVELKKYDTVKRFFPDMKIQNARSIEGTTFTFETLAGVQKQKAFGRDFTVETLNDFIYKVIDPFIQRQSQMPTSITLQNLEYINGRFKGTDFQEFTKGLSAAEVNAKIEDLGFSMDELRRLAWKDGTGNFIGNGQYLKEWLELIYVKIISYDINKPNVDPDIVKQQQKLLNFRDNFPAIYQELNTNPKSDRTAREVSSEKEWNMANEIFSSAEQLFGHGTIRFMLSNMVDFPKRLLYPIPSF